MNYFDIVSKDAEVEDSYYCGARLYQHTGCVGRFTICYSGAEMDSC